MLLFSAIAKGNEIGAILIRLGSATLTAIAFLVPVGSAGAAPPPGFDLFETDPETTQLAFVAGGTTVSPGLVVPGDGALVPGSGEPPITVLGPGTAIPAGFFGPGSDPFVGRVNFGGVPLDSFQGRSVGDADTIVRRYRSSALGPTDTAPIELVRLALRSVDPIIVSYEGGRRSERWSVEAGPSSTVPSRGEIQIKDDSTFDSQLLVVPLLTFTRLSDGRRRNLDMASIGAGAANALVFRQQNAPWRSGCVSPALAVPGLNDDFCPGLTPKGNKVLTVELAQLASHGIYPVQPALEHFQCYSTARSRFRSRGPVLSDQLGARQVKVTRRAELCNPVEKNGEPLVNRSAHLQCYATDGRAPNKLVAVQNQFGSQRLLVERPRRLCLPTAKRIILRGPPRRFPPIRVPVDHFQCYAVKSRSPLNAAHRVRAVKLNDQFGGRAARLGPAFQLCAPVQKRWKGRVKRIRHPVKHLVCYWLNRRKVPRRVGIRNQFERRIVRTLYSKSLCVPSNKLVLR